MSTAPFEQAIASTRSVLANVSSDDLDKPTPCASWKVSDLVNHIVGGQHFFAAGIQGSPPPGETDYASGDFLSAYDDAAKKAVDAFSADGVLEQMHKLPFGEMPGSAFLGLATTDTFQHGWDLAKATGQPTDLSPELAGAILDQARASIPDAFRGPEGAPFGPQAECPDDAPKADQLAAFLGRDPS